MIFKGRSEWWYQKRNRCRVRHDHRQIAASVVERFWWWWWFHRHPPSNSWVTFVLLGVIGSWSCLLIRERSDYSLSLFLSLRSVNQKCLQHSHYVRQKVIHPWFYDFKPRRDWHLMSSASIKIQPECQHCPLWILCWHYLLMFLVNKKKTRRLTYLKASFKTQVKSVHLHKTVLGVTVLVFTGTFSSLLQKEAQLWLTGTTVSMF